MSRVVLQGYIIVPLQDLQTVMAEFDNHKVLTLKEQGCLVFQVEQSKDNPYKLYVYEEFTDRTAFEAHQQRVKTSYWGKVSVNVQRYYNITE